MTMIHQLRQELKDPRHHFKVVSGLVDVCGKGLDLRRRNNLKTVKSGGILLLKVEEKIFFSILLIHLTNVIL